ncbi:hypothetical protein L1D22_00715 [Vibrio sp. Isolate34]|uniref:hypothetical protein n=1 Tax=Vibrio sp. Isolate34 TaxID=2908540 RepID=UPI001EFE5889|nr:hypothetical protein [Vibrio sp. Isolate34]MCG9638474.1 hypothetical protein [Vibrio sp. Isolate34]
MKTAELFDECEQIMAYEHFYGTSDHFFRVFELSSMVVGDAYYGPFTLKQVQRLLWELSELSNRFSIIHKPQECYGFKVLGFCVELDNGFYGQAFSYRIAHFAN